MIKAIIFDLDDTLISEMQYIESGYRHISELLTDITHVDDNSIFSLLMDLFHDSPKNVFNRLFDKLNISYKEDNILKLVEIYRNHEPHIQFFDDVLPNLELLKVKGIKTGIITDGYISTQRNKLRILNANKYFDHIIVTQELGRKYWKPHPRPFELMKDKLNIEFNEMVYVGDNPEKDFYISCIYPIKTVRIDRENSIHRMNDYYYDIKENLLIRNLNELLKTKCQLL